ncbi:unnamed protein product [Peronospora belbahrii]|uniref:Protein kinase domain-containing protein n=1 Tax=Peronospora belbahrii TaxID=622444 RepID=A0ABN8CN69_9STRA|nr:unnamed protein product [Peronospora belbahrii]
MGQFTQILHIGESARSIFLLDKASEQRLYNKLRLLKRALTCIDVEIARDTAEYTEICIMLTKLSDSEKGVRQNFQEMKKRRVGEKQPLRYEEEAAFEYEAGNKEVAKEILELGVDNNALTSIQKEKLLNRVIAGRAGWVAAFSGSPQEQKVLALQTKRQALRKIQGNSVTNSMQNKEELVVTTPRGCAATSLQLLTIPADITPISYSRECDASTLGLNHMLMTPSNATPVSHGRNGESFSTVSKIPHRGNKSPLPTTPLLPTRSSLKSQSTLRKPPARFTFGGPPLRVIATNREDDDDNDEDDDDAMMESQTTPTRPEKSTATIEETEKAISASPAIKCERMLKPKIDVGDISHILKWNPDKEKERKGTCTDRKDTKVSLDIPAKLTGGGAQLQALIEKRPQEKSIETLAVPPAIVQRLPQSREVQPVLMDVSVPDRKSSVVEHYLSPRMKSSLDSRADTALKAPLLLDRSTITRTKDHYRSPKRRQLDPSVAVRKKQVDLSSPSSISSPSSPLVASLSSNSSRDALESLTSRVVVNGLKYIKLEQIGSGGSSKVYRMLGPDLKIYALKKIKLKKLDAKSIAQYTNEIKLLKRLQGNPHIIKLIAAEQDLQQRQINVIMEHGEIDLSARLRDLNGGMDENLLRVIWTQMLQAVDAIHRTRIIHGDLKPANFLFVNGALKLIDFGIAKAIPSNDTTNIERDSQIGTVNYMSPEAIQGNTLPNGERDPEGKMKVGRASDIWSLGCILYQIVYSKPPFADVRSIIDKFRCIIDPAVPIPFSPLQNQDLENVIRSCLQRDHRRRPPITGERGLLSHPFLRSGGSSACEPSVTMGLPSGRVNMFMSIGQEGLRNETQVEKGFNGRRAFTCKCFVARGNVAAIGQENLRLEQRIKKRFYRKLNQANKHYTLLQRVSNPVQWVYNTIQFFRDRAAMANYKLLELLLTAPNLTYKLLEKQLKWLLQKRIKSYRSDKPCKIADFR